MILKSDFLDWYDYEFDGKGEIFSRFSRSGMSRPEMMEHLKSLGYIVPQYGLASDIETGIVVVHADINSHRGEGKFLRTTEEAIKDFPRAFCMKYIDCQKGQSFRKLIVGNKMFHIKYWSDHNWRSNCGEGVEEVIESNIPVAETETKLYAIDFVMELRTNKLFAVDYNIAPSLAPLKGIITAKEVLELLGQKD